MSHIRNTNYLTSLLLFFLLSILPMMAAFLYASLYSIGLVGLASHGLTIQHWQHVWADSGFWGSLLFSLYQAMVGLLLTVLLALLLFSFLQRKFRDKLSASSALFVPLSMAPVVVGFAFFGLWSNSGFVARLLFQMGILGAAQEFPNVVQGSAGTAILLAHLFVGVPFFVINYFNIYKTQQMSQLERVAESLGANSRQRWLQVQLPVLWQQSKPIMWLYFLFFFGAYEIPLLLGSSANRMFSVLIVDKLHKFNLADKPQAFVMSAMYFLMVFVWFFGVFKRKKR